MVNNAEVERNKQLRRIADSLEKIARCMNKNVANNITLDSNKLVVNYDIDNEE